MAGEGVFTIQADIVPTIDQRALEQAAANISGQLNALVAKNTKTISISGSTQGFDSKVIDSATKSANVFNAAINETRRIASSTTDAIKNGFQAATNFVGLTNKNVQQFGFNLIDTIKNTSKFNDSLSAIQRSTEGLKGLPDTFQKLGAQVSAGVSSLDLAARSGDAFAAALVPITRLTEGVREALVQVDAGVQALTTTTRNFSGQAGSDFDAARTHIGLLKDPINDLRNRIGDIATKTTPQFGAQLKETFQQAAALGPEALIEALQRVRSEQGKAIAEGGGAIVNVSSLIRAALFDIDKDALSFRDRFVERFSRIAASINSNFIAPVKFQIQQLLTDTEFGTGFVTTFTNQFNAVRAEGVSTFQAIKLSLADTFTNTNIGQSLKGVIEDARGVANAISTQVSGAFRSAQAEAKKLQESFSSGGISGAARTAFADVGKSFSNIFKGEGGGGEAGSASLNLLLAPLNLIKNALGGLGTVATLPFKALGAAAGAAAPAVNIVKGLLGDVFGGAGLGGLETGGLAIGAAIAAIGTAAINTAAKFETYKVAFEGLFGPGQGQKVIDLALDFDQLTHFSLDTTIQAVEGLAGAIKNIQPEGALAILKQIGGAAAAVGAGDAQVQRVTLALTQISAAGRLTAQDLNQVTQALPDISRTGVYAQIAKDLNVTNQKAKDLAQQGLVDSEEGLSAVLKVANQVPGATEAMEKQSQTFKGLLTIVTTQLNKLLIQIGGPLLVAAKVVLQALILAFKELAPVIDVVGNVISKVFGFLGKITGLGSVFKSGIDGINTGLKETGTAGGVAALGINDAINALSAFKNSIVATQNLIGPALDQINVGLAKVIATANAPTPGVLGSLLDGIKGVTTAITEVNLAGQRNGLLAIQAGLSGLSDIKSPLQLEQRLKELQDFINTMDVPPDIKAKFEDVFAAGSDNIAKSNQAVHEALVATQAYADAQKAAVTAHEAVGTAIANVTKLQNAHDAQIKTDTIAAQRALDKSNQSLADSNDRVAESQTALNKILKGASSEDLEKADLSLASAKLRLRQILEDEKKATDAVNASQQTSVNLAGLNIDQIKSRLNNVRLSLSAQQATNAATVQGGKSAEQASIDAANAAITKRNAELDVLDATKAQQDLQAKGSATDPERIAAEKALAQAKRDQADQVFAQGEAQKALNKLKEPDVAFTEQLATANKAIQTAKDAAAEADFKSQQSLLQAQGNIEAENKLLADRLKTQVPKLTDFLNASLKSTSDRLNAEELLGITLGNDVIPKYQTLASIIDGINKNNTGLGIDPAKQTQTIVDAAQKIITAQTKFVADRLTLSGGEAAIQGNNVTFANGQKTTVNQLPVADLLKVLTSEAASISANAGVIFDVNKSENQILTLFKDPNVVNALVAAIIANPGSDIRKIFQKLFASLNIKVEGFAEGGLINGTPGAFGQLVRVGEHGRREAILPLENQARMATLLAHPNVLNPVLDALPRISLPGRSSAADLAAAVSAVTIGSAGSSGSPSNAQALARQEQARRDASLAKAIVAEMVSAGFQTGKQVTVQNDFTTPVSDDPLSKVKIAAIAREVKKQMEKDW